MKTNIKIRKAIPSDFTDIFALDAVAWQQNHKGELIPDGLHTWRIWIEHALMFVSLDGDKITGVAFVFPCLNQQFCLHKIFVQHSYRNEGIGTTLMQTLLQALDELQVEIFLTTNPRNTFAIAMYEKFGFVDKKLVAEFYGKDKDRYIMTRKINNK